MTLEAGSDAGPQVAAARARFPRFAAGLAFVLPDGSLVEGDAATLLASPPAPLPTQAAPGWPAGTALLALALVPLAVWVARRMQRGARARALRAESEVVRAREGAERSEERLARVLEIDPDAVLILEADGRISFANAAAERLFGMERGEITARRWDDPAWKIRCLEGGPGCNEALPFRQVLEAGEAAFGVEFSVERADGRRVTLSMNAAPFGGGEAAGLVASLRDITRSRRQERETAFLGEVSRLVFSSLDLAATLRSVARLTVPTLADLCEIALVEADGSIRQLEVAHADPRLEGVARGIARLYPDHPSRLDRVRQVIETGRPLVLPEIPASRLQERAQDERHLGLLRELDPRSALFVPLLARGRVLGVLTLVSSGSRRRLGEEDLALVQEVAWRAALALDNARLYTGATEAVRSREESLALLDTLLTTAPVGFAFLDPEFRFVRVNEYLCALSLLPPEEHKGRPVAEVLPALARATGQAFRKAVETGEAVTDLEFTGPTPGASSLLGHYLVGYYPVRMHDGRLLGVGALLLDITERRKQNEIDRFLAEANDLIASSLDYDLTLKRVARLAVRTLADWCAIHLIEENGSVRGVGLAHRDPGREPFLQELLRRYPPGLRSEGRPAAISHTLRTGEPILVSEITDADLKWFARDPDHLQILRAVEICSLMVVPLQARGHTLGAITLATTGRGHAFGEEDLAIATELAHRAAVALDNARLYQEAQAASQAKSDFLAVMSHELRTPLTAVIGYSDLLLAGVPEPLPEAMVGYVERIRASAWHQIGIIEQILTYSRTEAARERVRIEPVEIGHLIRSSTALIEPLAAEKGLAFRVELPPEPRDFDTDPPKVRQILLNLLRNAVQFTEQGEVWLHAALLEGRLVVRVGDTGVGIEPVDLERIFEPFWQVEQGPARRFNGTGLGLTLSRRLAELLGGEITVESRAGEGSVFTLTLPPQSWPPPRR